MLLGVDLGTSHTVAMLRRPDGRTRPLLFDGRPLLPSAVYLDTTGRLHVGPDALRLGHADPGRLEPHPKRHIDQENVLLGDAEVPVADLLAAVLGAVAREAVATAGLLPPAVLTYPAGWGAPRRQVLLEALSRAGWPRDTEMIPEPVAAARYFADVLRRPVPVGSSLAVFDFGGGTLDVAVARNDGGRFTVTASGGDDDLGGLDLDAALVDHLGKTLSGGEPQAWRALTSPATLAQWRARREFWESVRGAKEMLSRSSFAPVPVPGVEQAVHLTRDELEAAADPLVRRAVAEARSVIGAAGVAPADLAGLFLVGGSSRVPMVARLLHSELGIAPTVLEQPEFPVAEGATLVARFVLGTAAAATPTPTPATVHEVPPPITDTKADSAPITPTAAGPPNTGGNQRAGGHVPAQGDDRVYAQPVDPWATGEAAAIAAGGHGLFPSSPAAFPAPEGFSAGHGQSSAGDGRGHDRNGSPPRQNRAGNGPGNADGREPSADGRAPSESDHGGSRRKAYVLIAGAVAALLVIGGVSVWYLWPSDRALDFQTLGVVGHVPPKVAVNSSFADAEVIGDRVYFASFDSGHIGVVATDSDASTPAWSVTPALTADRWESMTALPAGVALLSGTDLKSQRVLAVLGAKDGDVAWSRTIGSSDDVYYVGDIAVLADDAGHQLIGLRQSDGKEKWRLANPKTDSGTSSAVFVATTSKDLNGPATVQGRPLSPDTGDDTRIVQVSGDRSARVIDAENGKVQTQAPGVAGTDDEVVVNDGRLIVRQSEGTQRIASYDLGKLGEPKVLYTAQNESGHLSHLSPCGEHVCFVEDTSYDAKTDAVTAVDPVKGGRVWKKALAGVDGLVPAGSSLLVDNSSQTTLLDKDGKTVWTSGGVAARLDNGNLLEFTKPLAGYSDDPFLAGQHLGDQPVQLGPLNDVRTDSCSWNKSVIACVGDKDFVILKFVK
jgi:actin-like ATPase involved in cell morphogenesis